jgi:hypothetical protein
MVKDLWQFLWPHLGTIVQEWSRHYELRKVGGTSAGGVDGIARGAGWFRDRAVFEDLYRGLAGKVGPPTPPSRTNWICLVPPVLTGHVSSLPY